MGDKGDGSMLLPKKVIVPAVLGVGALAAGKGPQLVQGLADTLDGARERAESKAGEMALETAKERLQTQGGLAGRMLSKALEGGGGGSGGKKTRRLPIQRWTDVAVPVETAYKAWSDFESYPKFMHRVLEVEQTSRNKVGAEERWATRETARCCLPLEAHESKALAGEDLVQPAPVGGADHRTPSPTTRSSGRRRVGMSHRGVVSFHKLDPNLTRVMVEMEFEPNGMVEKMASGLRFVKRAVQADLARFKAHVEMEDAKGIEYRAARDDDADRNRAKDGDADEAPTRSRRKS